MLRYQLFGTVVLTGALVVATQAQGLRGVVNKDADKNAPSAVEAEPVMDDDGGRVFIVRRNDADSIEALRYHGGAVIAEPKQYNIFLGDAWTEPKLQGQKTSLANLLSKGEFANDQPALEKYGVRNRFLPSASQEQLSDFSKDSIVSDLRIHSLMETWFRAGTLARPDAATIYVLFLPPGVSSKLGNLYGGKHFTAYHNFFNAEQGEIHYVVVPYDSDVKVTRQSAARAVLQAALNPRGDGWY